MTDAELQAIRDRWAKAAKGPWMWDVNKSCNQVLLESSGRYIVMGFRRMGMQGAQPEFVVDGCLDSAVELAVPRKSNHPNFNMDIIHPDAQAIANAPGDIAALLAEVRRLQAAEKVCELLCQNAGMHCSAMGKCAECGKETVHAIGLVCKSCIDKALRKWADGRNGNG